MAASFTLPTVLANLTAGNEPLSLIDGDFNALYNPAVSLNTYNNEYTDVGAANAYAVTVSSPQTVTQSTGLRLQFLAAHTNTGASTLQINALAVKNILNPDGTALVAGQILANAIIDVIFDGTEYLFLGALYPAGFGKQTANTFLAGPTSGGAAAPTFRILTASDITGSVSGTILLGSKTASNTASISFVNTGGTGDIIGDWTAFDEYEIHFVQLIPVTNATVLQIQISEDGGSTFKGAGTTYSSAILTWTGTATGNLSSSTTAGNLMSDGATGMQSNSTNFGLSGKLVIVKPSNAIQKLVYGETNYVDSAGPSLRGSKFSIDYTTDANAWTGMKFFYNSGNISSGTIYVYGVRKS